MSTRNFDALFRPRSIALIGASNAPGSIGAVLAQNLMTSGFAGPVMPVNPHAAAIRTAVCYPTIAALPEVLDLAVIATPPATIPGIVGELASRGCRAAVVITAGLDKALRQQMLEAARPALLRLVGPNCLGLISTGNGLNASFAAAMPRPGHLALVSQSGAIVAAMLDWADGQGVGFSHVVSLGDMADVDFGDTLDFLAGDAETHAILLYVETITNARKFMSAARIAARAKPVIVVKAGRSAGGAKAAQSHTGALAGADAVYDAAFRRAGLLRVKELDELFEAAATLATGLRVRNDRMVILTNGGGAGVLAADALEEQGGHLAELEPQTVRALDGVLPATWSHGNPVDIIGDAAGSRYAAALEVLSGAHDGDAILVINCPTAVADGYEAAEAVCAAAAPGRPLIANWLGGTAAGKARRLFGERNVPNFHSPETAVRAFMHLVNFRRNQTLLLEMPDAAPSVSAEAVAAGRDLLGAALAEGRSLLSEVESKTLLGLFGIPTVATEIAATPQAAAQIFEQIGRPVALKILSPDISHKSDAGGVRLNLASAPDVEAAAHDMLARIAAALPDARLTGFTVQEMIARPKAHELIAGIASDPTFGRVLLFGRGGTATEIVADRALGFPPLNSVLARDMIVRTTISRLLAGYRDVPPAAIAAIADTLVRLSEICIHLPEIAELDINPLLADADGVIALDARIVVKPPAQAARLAIEPYPRELETDLVLADGECFAVRPIKPEDEAALSAMVDACTPEDLRLRFFNPLRHLPREMAARLSQIDYDREMALVAVTADRAIHGVVRLICDPEIENGEYAILVRSDAKGHGLGYRLMEQILAYARRRGLRRVHGDVLGENSAMLAMAAELGFAIEPGQGPAGVVRIALML
jgi:acetyltransferase